MMYRVVILRRADKDTNAIYVWLAKRSVGVQAVGIALSWMPLHP